MTDEIDGAQLALVVLATLVVLLGLGGGFWATWAAFGCRAASWRPNGGIVAWQRA